MAPRIGLNTVQIFHIDRRTPSDLDPAHVVASVRRLRDRLFVVRGDDTLGTEIQPGTLLMLCMHLRETFAACRTRESYHIIRKLRLSNEWSLKDIIYVTARIAPPAQNAKTDVLVDWVQ